MPERGTARGVLRSASMKLVFGFVAYLAAAIVVVAAALAGMSTIFGERPKEQPVLASGTDGRSAGPGRVEEPRTDPQRVPVWIAPTAKYQYTPVPANQAPKRSAVIGGDARGAMAKSRRNSPVQDGIDIKRAPSPGLSSSSRDNDPFFRD